MPKDEASICSTPTVRSSPATPGNTDAPILQPKMLGLFKSSFTCACMRGGEIVVVCDVLMQVGITKSCMNSQHTCVVAF